MEKNALIILAHGSRRLESNKAIDELTKKVHQLSNGSYTIITRAYLELAEPSLLQEIDNVIKKNISNIIVIPYFLSSGNHVKQDIPAIIKQAKEKHPNCKFKITPYIGLHEDMPKLILNQTNS